MDGTYWSFGDWAKMALGMEVGAAFFYGVYRVGPRTAVGPSGGKLLGGAILSAVVGVVFLLIGIGTWVVSLF